jgi:Rieske Fe-S protein
MEWGPSMIVRHLESPTRREFLGCACRWGAGLAALSLLPARDGIGADEAIMIAWSDLPDGSRTVVMDGELPVEVHRAGDEVRARSLLCTHQGCQVKWHADRTQYVCPCHEGVFDPSGHPVMGPPRAPLREFAVERRGDHVRIDTSTVVEAE